MDTNTWMMLFTGGLVLVGILQLWVFGLQARRLRQTIDTMDKTAERQLRAYVLPENGGIIDGLMMEPPRAEFMNVPGIGLIIKNTGQTPAHRVASRAEIGVIPVAEQAGLATPTVEEKFFSTLGAGTWFTKSLRLPRALTAEELQASTKKRWEFSFGGGSFIAMRLETRTIVIFGCTTQANILQLKGRF